MFPASFLAVETGLLCATADGAWVAGSSGRPENFWSLDVKLCRFGCLRCGGIFGKFLLQCGVGGGGLPLRIWWPPVTKKWFRVSLQRVCVVFSCSRAVRRYANVWFWCSVDVPQFWACHDRITVTCGEKLQSFVVVHSPQSAFTVVVVALACEGSWWGFVLLCLSGSNGCRLSRNADFGVFARSSMQVCRLRIVLLLWFSCLVLDWDECVAVSRNCSLFTLSSVSCVETKPSFHRFRLWHDVHFHVMCRLRLVVISNIRVIPIVGDAIITLLILCFFGQLMGALEVHRFSVWTQSSATLFYFNSI